MRAAKARNLIFLGTKAASPAKEASVEIVFDNSDNEFETQEKEVSVKRIVRKNGQSIYKINSETKTRQEVLALLAQAGIDPNGFNIVLQGEIQNFVRVQPEERRGVIEEVAGISIYEARKEKSLKELEKTEERLKEVAAILKERSAYLSNLEREREAAMKYKKFEEDIKKFKKSIIFVDLSKKKKDSAEINNQIAERNKEIEKIKKVQTTLETEIKNLEEKISEINLKIQKQTGHEQEKLNQEISNLRADLAGLIVKKENYEKKLNEIERKKLSLHSSMEENEVAIHSLQNESPTAERTKKELSEKKIELEKLEAQIKKRYMQKSELHSLNERLDDKKMLLSNYSNESSFLLEQTEMLTKELFDKKTDKKIIEALKFNLSEKRQNLENLEKREREIERIVYSNKSKIEENKKIIEKVKALDVCPLCKSKITSEHLQKIGEEINPKTLELEKEIQIIEEEFEKIKGDKNNLKTETSKISEEISKRQNDLTKLHLISEKSLQIKSLQEKIEELKTEIGEIVKRRKTLEATFDANSNVEEKYETLKVEVEEISLRSKENLSSEIAFKQRELERARISVKQLSREKEELNEELKNAEKMISQKEKLLETKRKDEEELTRKAKKLIEERDACADKIRNSEIELSEKRNVVHNIEQSVNDLKIEKAKKDAEVENLEIEILEFPESEIVRMNRDVLIERLRKTEETLIRLGNVNMRALEVYDEIKKEYDSIKEKSETILKEKEGVLKIISEIDLRKKKTFLKTLAELNELFTRNFSQISTKGQVFLELQNKKEPFDGGVDIIVKTGHGKYFDIKSLSGGEQTMVALSLIFAIQELKPYCFYILDEIDAALDKRNSERLSTLLKKYMQKGQYIVITHNDEIITSATNLFGVSMHEGISKIISLKV